MHTVRRERSLTGHQAFVTFRMHLNKYLTSDGWDMPLVSGGLNARLFPLLHNVGTSSKSYSALSIQHFHQPLGFNRLVALQDHTSALIRPIYDW
jgi:hypothetical protein